MKKSCVGCCLSLLAIVFCAQVFADEGAAPSTPNTNEKKRWSAASADFVFPENERNVDRMLANPGFVAALGISDDTASKLRIELKDIQEREIDLNAQIRKLALNQADQMAQLLQSANVNTNELMRMVETIGKCRTEQAKLAIQSLLILHQYLTPDQIRRAHELVRERMQQKERGDLGLGGGKWDGKNSNPSTNPSVQVKPQPAPAPASKPN